MLGFMNLSKDIEATFSLRIVDFHFTVISALIPNAYRKRVYRSSRYTLFLCDIIWFYFLVSSILSGHFLYPSTSILPFLSNSTTA